MWFYGFNHTLRRNFTLQASVSVAIKMLMSILFKHRIGIIHVLHDEVWILIPEEMNIDSFIDEPLKEFEEKINNTFLGFPTNGLLTKETIGGKYNE